SSSVPPPQTRFVRSTKYRSRAGSIHSDVPVNPACPKADEDIFVPHEEVGSIVSHPSARELPGTSLLATARATSAGESGGGIDRSPRALRSTVRANPPTDPAVPNRPACPAAPPSAAA